MKATNEHRKNKKKMTEEETPKTAQHISHVPLITLKLFICNCLIFQMLLRECWKITMLIRNNHLLSRQPKIVSCKKHLWEGNPFSMRQVYFFFPSPQWNEKLHCQQASMTTSSSSSAVSPQLLFITLMFCWFLTKNLSIHSPHRETWISHDAPVRSWAQSTWHWSWDQKDRRAALWR